MPPSRCVRTGIILGFWLLAGAIAARAEGPAGELLELVPRDAAVTLTVEGVYDFYCIPHEHAGMVGRIIVGNAGSPPPDGSAAQALPDIALQAFPSIDEIMRKGIVRRT